MSSTLLEAPALNRAVVASYKNHNDAEEAVRTLAAAGIAMTTISIIGRNYETREDIQGFYHPADAAVAGAGQGAWFGGFFGLMLGAFGFFVLPGIGGLVVLGPLSGFIAGAIGGAGIGALVMALTTAGVPRGQALKYQERLQAGEFLLVVHGDASETTRAHEILEGTPQTHLQTHGEEMEDTPSHSNGTSGK